MIKLQSIKQDEIMDKLNSKRIDVFENKSNNNKVFEIESSLLINHLRFDIMAKYIYGKFRENNWKSDWGARLYENHIWVFNQYDEDDGTGKKGIKAFYESFDSTLDSIKKNGFDDNVSIIPIGRNNELLDGAHRITAAILYNKSVKVVKFENLEVNYNYDFFRRKGMLPKWSDAIAYEYCKLKQTTNIVIQFSRNDGHGHQIREIIKSNGNIFYEKKILIKNYGLENLLKELDIDEIDTSTIFNRRFNYLREPIKILAFVIEADFNINISKVKNEITETCDINKEFIYMSRTHEETVRIAQLLFNENSIHFINFAQPRKFERFKREIEHYKRNILEKGKDREAFCIISDAVLAAYGICNLTSFDFISVTTKFENKLKKRESSNLIHYKKSIDDVIFNPENHFYFDGIKFASLAVVKGMKKGHYNTKDIKDIYLINKFLIETTSYFNIETISYNIKKNLKIMKLNLLDFRFKCKQIFYNALKRN